MRIALVLACFPGLLPHLAQGQTTVETSAGAMQITAVATGFDEAWGPGFPPDGSFLLTGRAGRLQLVRGGQKIPVAGVPEVVALGQGGLPDVMIPRDFGLSREVWLSYAAALSGGRRRRWGVACCRKTARHWRGSRRSLPVARCPGRQGTMDRAKRRTARSGFFRSVTVRFAGLPRQTPGRSVAGRPDPTLTEISGMTTATGWPTFPGTALWRWVAVLPSAALPLAATETCRRTARPAAPCRTATAVPAIPGSWRHFATKTPGVRWTGARRCRVSLARRVRGKGWYCNGCGSISRNGWARQTRRPAPR